MEEEEEEEQAFALYGALLIKMLQMILFLLHPILKQKRVSVSFQTVYCFF